MLLAAFLCDDWRSRALISLCEVEFQRKIYTCDVGYSESRDARGHPHRALGARLTTNLMASQEFDGYA